MWVSHPDTAYVVTEAWNRKSQIVARIKSTKLALKEWNRTCFGNVQRRIRDTKELIQLYQSSPPDSANLQAEVAAQTTLDSLLKREEQLWRDKAKARWIDEGDANTRFFSSLNGDS